ncbi:MAG: large-conductance mechanosensitive channel protein MscL [Prolixibacteraceae bacterium]
MSIGKEFKEFAMRGNVVDMAVGIIIGAAFGKIITSFVTDVLMPPLGMLLGGADFRSLKIQLSEPVISSGKAVLPGASLNYGNFIQVTVDFLIIAFAIFMMVKMMNRFMKKNEVPAAPPAPPEPSKEELLLTEIRDLLKDRK